MQVMAALRHVDDIFTIQRIVGRYVVYDLFNSQAVMVIGELRVGASLYHAGQHTSGFPCKRPTVIGRRVANRIIGNRLTADGRNLVLPVAVAIVFQVYLFSGFQFFKYMDKYRTISAVRQGAGLLSGYGSCQHTGLLSGYLSPSRNMRRRAHNTRWQADYPACHLHITSTFHLYEL